MDFKKWSKLHSLNADIRKALSDISECIGEQIETGQDLKIKEDALYKKYQIKVMEYEKLRKELYEGVK